MARKRSTIGLAVTAGCLLVVASPGASAGTLDSLINAPTQTDTSYSLSFMPMTTSTTITFEGYQTGTWVDISHIGLFLDGTGSNLLGGTWSETPAVYGSGTTTYSDGTSVPALSFLGSQAGDYDAWSQTITVTPDASYTLDFLYTNGSDDLNGMIVTASNIAPVSEPATGALMLIGLLGLAAATRTRSVRPFPA